MMKLLMLTVALTLVFCVYASVGNDGYVIAVIDEGGSPIEGVMVQLCDESTCMAAFTDAEGVIRHAGNGQPIEVHVLKAPEGYAANDEVYSLPESGGSLTITLKGM